MCVVGVRGLWGLVRRVAGCPSIGRRDRSRSLFKENLLRCLKGWVTQGEKPIVYPSRLVRVERLFRHSPSLRGSLSVRTYYLRFRGDGRRPTVSTPATRVIPRVRRRPSLDPTLETHTPPSDGDGGVGRVGHWTGKTVPSPVRTTLGRQMSVGRDSTLLVVCPS